MHLDSRKSIGIRPTRFSRDSICKDYVFFPLLSRGFCVNF
ncbi:hypothetical protein LEP1GSC047_1796 [Leptospira inadai serovar Lyme str. 10]|uniref:Uncharacterized protein n=1 Tax=Leptospira inadai serovar Lyme str. 10 TaxID=1049790 RepID=V6HGT2_9LEPT|nr:hypothetical protein LEP1GSC047_1796 [Leptospira inadai serovar Lyme str. 10]